jgi:hypothetical protein
MLSSIITNTNQAEEVELIIVYNAESGFFNSVSSSVHKFVSPETYSCQLCRVSHGLVGMLGPWKTYLERLPVPVRSYHRSQFQTTFPDYADTRLPSILLRKRNGDFTPMLEADVIERAGNLMTLINLLNDALQGHEDLGSA